MLKKSISITAILIASLFYSCAYSAPIEIRFNHVVSETTPKGQMANRFRDLVKERIGDDKVIVKVFPDETYLKGKDQLPGIIDGRVEIIAPSLSKFKNYSKKLQLFDLPFLFRSPEAANRFMKSDEVKPLLESMRIHGIEGIGFMNNGMKQMSATKRFTIPFDIQGLKFRIMSSDVIRDQYRAAKADGIKSSGSAVVGLINSKQVDGQENTWSNIYARKLHEIQPYILESNHGYLGYMVVTSTSFWNETLPDDLRPQVHQALLDAIDYGNKVAFEKAEADRAEIIKSGKSEVIQITPTMRSQWLKVMAPVWRKYEREIGRHLITAAMDQK